MLKNECFVKGSIGMKILYSLFLLMSSFIVENHLCATCYYKTYGNSINIGPEFYYVKRAREGGSEQTGMLYGIRVGYDHVKRYKFYWGLDALWATGNLNGKFEDHHLESRFTDTNVEGRLGYTFQSKHFRCASFTPFIGIGYFWELNHYHGKSDIHVHFRNEFYYLPVGFLSQVFITPTLSMGLNFKVRFPIEGKQKVTNDPEFDDMTQQYEQHPQYRVDLPITYFYCWNDYRLATCVMPFYEYRHYGHRANFPFDFLDTKFNIYGISLQMLYLF